MVKIRRAYEGLFFGPFILHHVFGLIGVRRNTKPTIEVNRYRKTYAIKDYVFLFD